LRYFEDQRPLLGVGCAAAQLIQQLGRDDGVDRLGPAPLVLDQPQLYRVDCLEGLFERARTRFAGRKREERR
jgi:hypothetical protein